MTWAQRAVLSLAVAGGSLAAGAVPAFGGQEAARPVPAYQTVDPVTGATFTFERSAPGEARFEIRSGAITVRKAVAGGVSSTTMLTRDGRMDVVVGHGTVKVTTAGGEVEGRPGDRVAADQIRATVAGSAVFRDALQLLARVARGPNAPLAHLVWSTRNALATLRGERPGHPPIAQRMTRRPQPALVTAALTQTTPGECWDIYEAEAIDIYMEYESCVDSRNWWDLIGLAACATAYELQASGAFAWWLHCTAIRS